MSYVGHVAQEEPALLAAIGVGSFEDLLAQVPEDLRLRGALDLAPGLTEPELRRHFLDLAARNYDPEMTPSFLGAGIYDHAIPALIDHLAARSEFYTAYTPYQPEVSQGTLAAIFEFQTMICELTGLEVANASLYDGASAAAEAVLLARSATRAGRLLTAAGVHPRTRQVIRTYLEGTGMQITALPERDGRLKPGALREALATGEPVGAVLIQQPNFFGLLEPLDQLAPLVAATQNKTHLIVSADPLSLGALAAPGTLGAETVVGDLQPLGIPPQFGGPTGGYFATRRKWIRRLPGRLVAEAHDAQGRRGYALTLQTREQHIRREKATSNICTNSGLLMLRATIHLALLGASGLGQVAEQCRVRSAYARQRLLAIPGVEAVHGGPYFREFLLRLPRPAAEVVRAVYERAGILAGVPLGATFPGRERELLVAVTEKRTRGEIDALAEAVRGVLA